MLDSELDRAIELQDLRAVVLAGGKLDPARYRLLVTSLQAGREGRAKALAADKKKAKKTLSAPAPIDFGSLFAASDK